MNQTLDAGHAGVVVVLILVVLAGLLLLLLFVGAVISIFKSDRTNETKILWTVVCLFLQLFGPLAWFLVGRGVGQSKALNSPSA